jgi:hypothetical protein
MSVVVAAPELLDELGQILQRGAGDFRQRGQRLNDALSAFFAVRPEFGPESGDLAESIAAEARVLGALAVDIGRFVGALRSADAAGQGLRLVGPLGLARSMVLVIDEDVLDTYSPIDSATTVVDLIARLGRQLDDHGDDPARRRNSYSLQYLRWRIEGVRLAGHLRQLQTTLAPPHRTWGGVDDLIWGSASDYLMALSKGRALAERRSGSGPFIDAAVATAASLSPGHVAILGRLDELAAMPLTGFIAARVQAQVNDPLLDWTSDGCSGPIPPGATDTCLRHDFLYRNARMLRDQWGLDPAFTRSVKQFADDNFGKELEDSYDEWIKVFAPPLQVWIDAAEVVVTVVGDVSEAWNPPSRGRFYGAAHPEE